MDKNEKILKTLKSYLKLSADVGNHPILLKEKTVLLYTAALLESENTEVISLSLDVLENFVKNPETHEILIGTFGVFEALEYLRITFRESNPVVSEKAKSLVDALRFSAPLARNKFANRRSKPGKVKGSCVFHVYVENLTNENFVAFEECLVRIRGVVSFVTDLQKKKCSIRIGNKTSIQNILQRIYCICGLKAFLIKKYQGALEVYQDVVEENPNESRISECFSEDESIVKDKCLVKQEEIRGNEASWLKSAKELWQKNFYW